MEFAESRGFDIYAVTDWNRLKYTKYQITEILCSRVSFFHRIDDPHDYGQDIHLVIKMWLMFWRLKLILTQIYSSFQT